MGQKGLVSVFRQAETPRFYHIGMSEEQISHSHQERLSQGQILHKGIRIHPSSLWIELIDMNRKGHAIAWCKMCITFRSYQVCIWAIPRYILQHTHRYLQDIDFHFYRRWFCFPRKTLVAYLSPLYHSAPPIVRLLQLLPTTQHRGQWSITMGECEIHHPQTTLWNKDWSNLECSFFMSGSSFLFIILNQFGILR